MEETKVQILENNIQKVEVLLPPLSAVAIFGGIAYKIVPECVYLLIIYRTTLLKASGLPEPQQGGANQDVAAEA
jgi:hypothetical protein